MEQQDWSASMSLNIAREVRRHRQARGMSAQQLADACGRLGADVVTRTVISNLENGRRGNVSVAEVLVLAAGLEVPPVALLFPAGFVEEVEYLPGVRMSPLDAADRWNGEGAAEDSALGLMRRHRALEGRIRSLYRGLWERAIADYRWHGEPGGPEAQAAREMARELTEQLHGLREEMSRRGLVLPEVVGVDGPQDREG